MIESGGLAGEGAGQPSFAGAGLAGDDQILMGSQPFALWSALTNLQGRRYWVRHRGAVGCHLTFGCEELGFAGTTQRLPSCKLCKLQLCCVRRQGQILAVLLNCLLAFPANHKAEELA